MLPFVVAYQVESVIVMIRYTDIAPMRDSKTGKIWMFKKEAIKYKARLESENREVSNMTFQIRASNGKLV